jgi:hypothetical protein
MCPECDGAFAGTTLRRTKKGIVVECPIHGLIPWRARFPQSPPLIIDQPVIRRERPTRRERQRMERDTHNAPLGANGRTDRCAERARGA